MFFFLLSKQWFAYIESFHCDQLVSFSQSHLHIIDTLCCYNLFILSCSCFSLKDLLELQLTFSCSDIGMDSSSYILVSFSIYPRIWQRFIVKKCQGLFFFFSSDTDLMHLLSRWKFFLELNWFKIVFTFKLHGRMAELLVFVFMLEGGIVDHC